MRNNNLHMRRTMFREVSKMNRENSRNNAKYDDTEFIVLENDGEKSGNEFSDKVIFVIKFMFFSFFNFLVNFDM